VARAVQRLGDRGDGNPALGHILGELLLVSRQFGFASTFSPTRPSSGNPGRLLLDSRVVDLSMASNPTFVFLSSLKPLFFNSPEKALHFSDNTGA